MTLCAPKLKRKRRKRLPNPSDHIAPETPPLTDAHQSADADVRPARRSAPERRCVATGASLSPQDGLRFVLSPQGDLAPDFSGKLPGRGAWIEASRSALATALKKGGFARSLKAAAPAADDLAARVEAGLAKATLSALGLARKTGDAVVGFEKVRTALKENSAAVLLNAVDGGPDGRRKLAGLAGETLVIELFTEAELSAALGRDEPTVHVALKTGPAATRFLREARKLEGFRSPAADAIAGDKPETAKTP